MGDNKNFFKSKRSWSLFKDEMLSWYLKPYMYKLMSIPKRLYIIDCFAGRGKFEDGSEGSPLIISKQIQSIVNEENRMNKDVQGVFIEKKYAKALQENISEYKNCKVVNGDFEDKISNICIAAKQANVFLYLDPYGVKHLKFDYLDQICGTACNSKNSLEMFINFNSVGFIREACRILKYNKINIEDEDNEELLEHSDLSEENMNKVFNGDLWKGLVADFYNDKITFHQLEEALVNQYLVNYRDYFKFILNIPIKTKQKNIPKYRMIFCTNNEDGLLLMNKDMNKVLKEMKDAELKGQMTFFNLPQVNDVEDLENYIITNLETNKYMHYKNLACRIINETNIVFTEDDIKDELKDLEEKGLICIVRTPINGYKPQRKLTGWNTKKYSIVINKA